MAAAKSTPKDAQVMASILKEVGIHDHEPRVLNQMLEFTYRYVTSTLEDAQQFSLHAKKKSIDIDDVKLAMQLHVDRHFTPPPPRELLLELSRQKNGTILPLIKSTAGPRLPPDRYSLTACNYHLRSNKKPKLMPSHSRLNITSLQPSSGSGAIVTKATPMPTVSVVPRCIGSTTLPKAPPTPIIKFSDGDFRLSDTYRTMGNRGLTPSSSPIGIPFSPSVTSSMPSSQIVMPTLVVKPEPSPLMDHGIKRKNEDDDEMDYDS